MLQINTTKFPSGSPGNLLDVSSPLTPADERIAVRREPQREFVIDDALAESFPASDPPAWNPGMARPIPVDPSRERGNDKRSREARDKTGTPGVIGVSRPSSSGGTVLQGLISLGGAASIALVVPFVVLLVGLPFALAVRGLLEVLVWLFPGIR